MNCSDCKHWSLKDELSNSVECIGEVVLTTRRGLCNNKAMNDSIGLYVDDAAYQKAYMDFDLNFWPPSWDETKRGTPPKLFRWETTEDFGCILHEKQLK